MRAWPVANKAARLLSLTGVPKLCRKEPGSPVTPFYISLQQHLGTPRNQSRAASSLTLYTSTIVSCCQTLPHGLPRAARPFGRFGINMKQVPALAKPVYDLCTRAAQNWDRGRLASRQGARSATRRREPLPCAHGPSRAASLMLP